MQTSASKVQFQHRINTELLLMYFAFFVHTNSPYSYAFYMYCASCLDQPHLLC